MLDCTDSANEFMPTVERAGEILESLSSTNEPHAESLQVQGEEIWVSAVSNA